jgi:hypothetical protein
MALDSYGKNLAQILTRIRAKYQGKLVLTTYASPVPALDPIAAAVNSTMTTVAGLLSTPSAPITIADGFTAFQILSAPFNHDACQAGLLIPLPFPPATPCDIHPSRLGQDALAVTVELAIHSQH